MLKGHKFIVLPNENSTRRRFMRNLIEKNGGGHGCEIGLVDDSYVESHHLINHDLFYGELKPQRIDLTQLQLFKLSSLSTWLKHGSLDLSHPLELHEEILIESEDSFDSKSDLHTTFTFEDDNSHAERKGVDFADESTLFESKDSGNQFSSAVNINGELIRVLERLAKRYKLQNDTFRYLGYMKMLTRLKTMTVEIETEEDALAHGLSKGLSRKIPLLLKLSNLGDLEMDVEEQTLLYFQQCYGIGASKSKASFP